MCAAADRPVDNSASDQSSEVSLGGLSMLKLGEMLEAERSYLLAIATQELGLHLKSKGGASDLVQETFLNATRDLHHFSGQTSDEFRCWLRSILMHNLLNFRRQYLDTAKRDADREISLGSSHLKFTLGEKVPSPSRVVMQAELAASLQIARQALSPLYQEIIELRSVRQLPFEEISRRLDRSADACRKLWCRAIEALQAELHSQSHDISGL